MHAAQRGDSPTALGSAIPTELLLAFERGELIVLAGPDLARSAGLPDREQLARELLAAANVDGMVDVPTLRGWIDEGRIEASLEIFERRLGIRFQRVTERLFADRQLSPPPLAVALASASDRLRAVYTTGIDRLLERAFADQWPSIATPQPDLVRRTKVIFKLCGTLEFRDTWVLTRAALEREFGERSLRRQLVATAYRAHCLLFVAFQPDDELIERLLSLVDLGSGMDQLPSHFVVFERCSVDQRALFERRGLHVIVGDPVAVMQALDHKLGALEQVPRDRLPACPYPGLQSFDDSLTTVFHGRRAEISQAASRLGGPPARHRRWLAIDGSSGVGKSSFVHAGLVPALRRGFAEGAPTRWLVASMRPGRHPLQVLVHALLSALSVEPRTAAHDAANATDEISAMVIEHMPPNTGLLVIVDQLEELVTTARTDESEAFADALGALLDQGLVYLVTTIRSDFVAALASVSPTLARRLNDGAERYTLAPISRVGLRLAIAEPAAQLGVTFEAELVERIATDAEQHSSDARDDDGVVRTDDAALPLVAHVLRALWDARAADDGVISFAEYNSLGGVSGALSRSVDALLGEIDHKQRNRTKALLLGMASLDDGRLTRRTLTRSEALELAGGDADGERLLNSLSSGGSRLLLMRGEGSDAVVDLVHEALLREWDTLRGWIEANRAQLAHDEALARRAAAWARQSRPWRSLPRGPERRELLRGRPHGREAATQREYQRAVRRSAWFRGAAWTGFVAALGLASLTLVDHEQRRRAALNEMADELDKTAGELSVKERQAELERSRQSIARLYDQHECHEALHQTLDLWSHDDSSAMRELLTRGVRCEAIVGRVGQLAHGPKQAVTAVAVDPRGREAWVGHADGELVRWELGADAAHEAIGLPEPIDYIRFAKAGTRVALGSNANGTTALRDIHGQAIGPSFAGTDPVFSPDGRFVASRQEMQVNLRDAERGTSVWSLPTEAKTKALEFTGDGERLVIAACRRTGSELIVADATSGTIISTLHVSGLLRDLARVGDANVFATAADDNFTRLWDLDRGEEVATPIRSDVRTATLRFVVGSPDGARVATLANNDGFALADGSLHVVRDRIEVHPDIHPKFSLDGQLLLKADSDARVALLDAGSGRELARVHTDGLTALAFSPSNSFVSGSKDGTATHWGVDTRTHWRGARAGGDIRALAFSPTDSRLLAFGSTDGHVRTWVIGSAEPGHAWPLAGWVVALTLAGNDGRVRALSDLGATHEGSVRTGTTPCSSRLVAMTVDKLALACADGRLLVWDPAAGAPSFETSAEGVTALALSPTSDTLAVGRANGELELLQMTKGAATHERWVGHHAGKVTSLAFDHAGTRLVSGGNDDTVRLWMPSVSGEAALARKIGGHNIEAVAISASGTSFAAGDDHDGSIAIWNDSGESIASFPGACAGHAVSVLQFSPDEQLLAAGCKDGNVRVWPLGADAEIEFACGRLARTSSSLPERCTVPTTGLD